MFVHQSLMQIIFQWAEKIINDKTISYQDKIPTIIASWEQLKQNVINFRYKKLDSCIDWAQRHTLNFVLHGDWTKQSEELKQKLYHVLEEFNTILTQNEKVTSRRCTKLIEVVRNPWGDDTLTKILNNPDKCTKEEGESHFIIF